MKYSDYYRLDNAALHLLKDCDLHELPIDAIRIANMIGIYVLPYNLSYNILNKLDLIEESKISNGLTGFIEYPIILYNEKMNEGDKRVVIGHEIGHIILEHVYDHKSATNLRWLTTDAMEYGANLFCEQLIAPTCVLSKMGVSTESKIINICDVNQKGAYFVLNENEKRMRIPKKSTQIEKDILKMFEEYINRNKE